jgi:TRAP-type C4-dicarboxylate transport system permease small subunit
LNRWRRRVAAACGIAAGAFLVAMMLLTVADVALRAVTNRPIRGMFEIVELLLACTFFIALPAVFLRDENLVVDVIDACARAGCRGCGASPSWWRFRCWR